MYYLNGEALETKTKGAIWFDQFESVKVSEAVAKLNENYKTTAMKVTLEDTSNPQLQEFQKIAQDFPNMIF